MTEQEQQWEILDKIKPFGEERQTEAGQILAAGKSLQRVQTPYTTAIAVQRPRSLSKIVANVLEEATLAGRSFYYGWEVESKKTGRKQWIEGPSIDLSMCLARHYGNAAIDVEVEETLTHYQFRGVFIDLESGFTCPRLFRQRKSQSIGMKDVDRQEDIVFQIGQSKAIRNAVVRAMPDWLIQRAIDAAKEAELGAVKKETTPVAAAKVINWYKKHGVSQDRIEKRLGRPADLWTEHDIVDLRGMATALKEGRVTAEEMFAENGESPSAPATADIPTQPEPTAEGPDPDADTSPAEGPAPPPDGGLFEGDAWTFSEKFERSLVAASENALKGAYALARDEGIKDQKGADKFEANARKQWEGFVQRLREM